MPIPAGNISPDSETLTVDAREQLAVYDALPAALRALYDSLPEPEDVRNFQALWEIHGEPATLAIISGEIERLYPGWKRPQQP